jgi:uncharacterized surface protein with fasciclin (FAS1) repeats
MQILAHGRFVMKIRYGVLAGLVGAALLFGMPAAGQDSAEPDSAWLRVANYAIDTAQVAVMLNDAALPADPLDFTVASQHVPVAAGDASIAFDAGSGTLAAAQVSLEAGGYYTAALIGQAADDSLRAVVIPETDLVAQVRDAASPASYAILLHGISDGPTVDFTLDGVVLRERLSFGEYDVFPISQAPHDILVTFSDDPEAVLFQNSGETPPANDLLLLTVMAGAYPDALDVTGAVSRLPDRTLLDFLRSPSQGSFETLLGALEATGLAEELEAQGAVTLFAPTDDAFAALPEETRALLLAYPDALRAVLQGHIVDDVFVLRGLDAPLSVTTRQNTEIVLSPGADGVLVNDSAAVLFGGFPVVTNGNVIGIDRLLVPDAGA